MGYTTTFVGQIEVSPALSPEHHKALRDLADNDQRDKGDWQIRNPPSYYCQWEPTKNGKALKWDGNEKFYGSFEWMETIVAWLAERGYRCEGVISASGEETGDIWQLTVRNNRVSRQDARMVFEEENEVLDAEFTEVSTGRALPQTRRLTHGGD
jgi:hypothetical protein